MASFTLMQWFGHNSARPDYSKVNRPKRGKLSPNWSSSSFGPFSHAMLGASIWYQKCVHFCRTRIHWIWCVCVWVCVWGGVQFWTVQFVYVANKFGIGYASHYKVVGVAAHQDLLSSQTPPAFHCRRSSQVAKWSIHKQYLEQIFISSKYANIFLPQYPQPFDAVWQHSLWIATTLSSLLW